MSLPTAARVAGARAAESAVGGDCSGSASAWATQNVTDTTTARRLRRLLHRSDSILEFLCHQSPAQSIYRLQYKPIDIHYQHPAASQSPVVSECWEYRANDR